VAWTISLDNYGGSSARAVGDGTDEDLVTILDAIISARTTAGTTATVFKEDELVYRHNKRLIIDTNGGTLYWGGINLITDDWGGNSCRFQFFDESTIVANGKDKNGNYVGSGKSILKVAEVNYFTGSGSAGFALNNGLAFNGGNSTAIDYTFDQFHWQINFEVPASTSSRGAIIGNTGTVTGSISNSVITSNSTAGDSADHTVYIPAITVNDLFANNLFALELKPGNKLTQPSLDGVLQLKLFNGNSYIEKALLSGLASIRIFSTSTTETFLHFLNCDLPGGAITGAVSSTLANTYGVFNSGTVRGFRFYSIVEALFANKPSETTSFALIDANNDEKYIRTLDSNGRVVGGNINGTENTNNSERISVKIVETEESTITQQSRGGATWVAVGYGAKLASGTIDLNADIDDDTQVISAFRTNSNLAANLTTAAAYTGFAVTYTALNDTTATVSTAHTKQELHDWLWTKKASVANSGATIGSVNYPECFFPAPDLEWYELDTGTLNTDLTLSAALTGSGPLVLLNGKTTTIAADLDISGLVATARNGHTFVVASDADLSGITFESSVTISADDDTGPYDVSVAAGQSGNIIAGTGITLVAPQASIVAANVADGSRYYADHKQVFTVAVADISTGANTIALGNDSNGDAPAFAASSPYTTVRIGLVSGATMPTTSPQIVDGGRYYGTVSSGVMTLFASESNISGTPITISNAGVDSGGSVLTITTETELVNQSVSGGSGVSESLSLSDGATVIRKAIHWDNSSTTTSSPLYIQEFAWSATSGIVDPQVVDAAVEADSIHEQIIAASSVNFPGPIQNASGTDVTSLSPSNDGSALDASNSGPFSFLLEGGNGRAQINSDDADGLVLWQDLYVWGVFVASTAPGIRLVTSTTYNAVDIFNFIFDNLEIDNTSSTELNLVGGNGRSLDGSTLKATPQTGSGGVNLNALSLGTGAITETGTSGLTSGESAILSSLDTRTARVDGLIVDDDGDEFTTKALSNAGGDSAPTAAAIRAEIDANSTQLAAIVAYTSEIQTDWVNGGRLDVILNARASQSSVDTLATQVGTGGDGLTSIPWNAAWDAEVQSEVVDGLVEHTAPTTAELDAAVSGLSTFDANNDFVLVGGYDTLQNPPSVSDIRAEIDSNSTQLAAIIADTNELRTDWANGGRLDIILDNVSTFDGNLSGIAAQVWSYSGGDRTLSGSQATHLSSIPNIPTNPLLTTDSRLDFLDIAISSRSDFEATSDSVIVGDKTGFSLATTPPTALEISQAVWNEDDENRLVTIQAYSSGQAPDELIDLAPTNALITTVDSVVDAIKVKTDQLNFASGDVIATLDGETVNTGLSLSTIESNIGLLLDRLNMTVGKTVVTSPTSINIGSGETVISISVNEATNTVTSTRVT
jgi:hypothetical protein